MDEKERNQFVDELLDASLARYGNMSPRPGLEDRIMANARAVHSRRTWFVWAGWLGAGAAAALIAINVLSLRHRLTIPAPPKTGELGKPTIHTGPPGPVLVPPIQQAQASRKRGVQRAQPATSGVVRAEVRMPMFPSPTPPTEQEKLLPQYVRTTPAEVLSATFTGNEIIPNLEIKPLEITPLETEETEPKINQ